MLAAHRQGMTNGDYAFFNIELFNSSSYGNVLPAQVCYKIFCKLGNIFRSVRLKIHSTESQNIPLSLPAVAVIFPWGSGIARSKKDLMAIVATGGSQGPKHTIGVTCLVVGGEAPDGDNGYSSQVWLPRAVVCVLCSG